MSSQSLTTPPLPPLCRPSVFAPSPPLSHIGLSRLYLHLLSQNPRTNHCSPGRRKWHLTGVGMRGCFTGETCQPRCASPRLPAPPAQPAPSLDRLRASLGSIALPNESGGNAASSSEKASEAASSCPSLRPASGGSGTRAGAASCAACAASSPFDAPSSPRAGVSEGSGAGWHGAAVSARTVAGVVPNESSPNCKAMASSPAAVAGVCWAGATAAGRGGSSGARIPGEIMSAASGVAASASGGAAAGSSAKISRVMEAGATKSKTGGAGVSGSKTGGAGVSGTSAASSQGASAVAGVVASPCPNDRGPKLSKAESSMSKGRSGIAAEGEVSGGRLPYDGSSISLFVLCSGSSAGGNIRGATSASGASEVRVRAPTSTPAKWSCHRQGGSARNQRRRAAHRHARWHVGNFHKRELASQKPTCSAELVSSTTDEWDGSNAFCGNDSGSAATSGSSPDAPSAAVLASFAAMFSRREETNPTPPEGALALVNTIYWRLAFLGLLAHGSTSLGRRTPTWVWVSCARLAWKARNKMPSVSAPRRYQTACTKWRLSCAFFLTPSLEDGPGAAAFDVRTRRGCRQRKDKMDGTAGGISPPRLPLYSKL